MAKKIRVAYVAHQYGGRRENLEAAKEWVAWLAARYYIAPIADWILFAEQFPYGEGEGLRVDLELVKLAGVVILCGPRISGGMSVERDWSRVVVDITGGLSNEDIDRVMLAAGFELREAA